MEARHPGDVALDRRAAGYAISNPLAETAATTHGLLVQLENACGALANRAQKKDHSPPFGKRVWTTLTSRLRHVALTKTTSTDFVSPVTTLDARSREMRTEEGRPETIFARYYDTSNSSLDTLPEAGLYTF